MLKRIGLFLITNLLIVATISIVVNLLGVRPYLTANGIDLEALAVFCLIWGMTGSIISLLMSRMMAKWMLGVHVIDPRNPGEFGWLIEMVSQQVRAAGLPALPEIGVYESNEVNGFATGPTKKRSLLALSTGLIGRMNREEIAGVVGHELAHIKNGDMVTMTLLQGIMNAVVMFLARVIAYFASQAVREEQRSMVHFIVTIVLDILLGILASVVVFWFSRQREFRADAGSAQIAGRSSMIAALEALKRLHDFGDRDGHAQPASLATMKISGRPSGFLALFSTHPPLDERIARLRGVAV